MGLFSWLSSDSCGAHHWGSWKSTGDVAVFPTGMSNGRAKTVKVKQRRYCEHDCDASEMRWTREGTLRGNDILRSIAELSGDRQDDLLGLLEGIRDVDDMMIEVYLERMMGIGKRVDMDLTVDIEKDNDE